jgi:hypothetical protein
MIDDTPRPYIIVDNQIIQPISRSPRPDSTTGDSGLDREQSFGIVDRVTISKEGLEKSRQQAHEEHQPQLLENRSERLTHRSRPMLTYSPKGRG